MSLSFYHPHFDLSYLTTILMREWIPQEHIKQLSHIKKLFLIPHTKSLCSPDQSHHPQVRLCRCRKLCLEASNNVKWGCKRLNFQFYEYIKYARANTTKQLSTCKAFKAAAFINYTLYLKTNKACLNVWSWFFTFIFKKRKWKVKYVLKKSNASPNQVCWSGKEHHDCMNVWQISSWGLVCTWS